METNGEYTLSRTLWKSDTLRHPNVILAGFWQLLTVSHSLYTLAILVDKIITLEDIYRTFRTSFWQVQQTQAAYKKGVRFSIPQSQLQQTKQTMMSHDSSAHSTVSVMHCSLRLEGHQLLALNLVTRFWKVQYMITLHWDTWRYASIQYSTIFHRKFEVRTRIFPLRICFWRSPGC